MIEFLHIPLPTDRVDGIIDNYFSSFLQVCQGQDNDINRSVSTLVEYEEVVKRKTVAAYEFAAVVGARAASADSTTIDLCAQCGEHLGWMVQILDDLEALWFPVMENDPEIERLTFPVLLGLTIDHPNAQTLERLYRAKEYDRPRICALLDEMNVRTRLMNLALDHRDKAIEILEHDSFNPEGGAILKLWLDWLMRDGTRLLESVKQ